MEGAKHIATVAAVYQGGDADPVEHFKGGRDVLSATDACYEPSSELMTNVAHCGKRGAFVLVA